jgi:hypothetical protein
MRSCLCFVRKTSDSVHGDWRNSRAGCSTNLERCHDKCEFLHSLAQEFVELEVLKKMHSTHHQPELRHDRVPYARRGTHEVQAAIFGSISRSICTRRHVRFFEQAFDLFAGRRAEPQKISNDEIRQIDAVISLAVRLRGAVERDRHSREMESVLGAEGTARIGLSLERLLAGLDTIGVPRATAIAIVKTVALHSVPPLRLRAYDHLRNARRRDDFLNTEDFIDVDTCTVAQALGLPTNTVRRLLEDLAAYGLVERRGTGAGKADKWIARQWEDDP